MASNCKCPACIGELSRGLDYRLSRDMPIQAIIDWLDDNDITITAKQIEGHRKKMVVKLPTQPIPEPPKRAKRASVAVVPEEDFTPRSLISVSDWREIIPEALHGIAKDFGADLVDPLQVIGSIQKITLAIQLRASAIMIAQQNEVLEGHRVEVEKSTIAMYRTANDALLKFTGVRQQIDLSVALATVEKYRGGLETTLKATQPETLEAKPEN